MFTIYHAPYTRSIRVLWLCEEMGIAYNVEQVSTDNPSPAFVEANPLKTTPVLVDGDEVLTESIAIMLYLLGKNERTELAIAPGEKGYADYLQFLIVGEAGLAMNAGPMVAARQNAPDAEKMNWSARHGMERLFEGIGTVDARLADGRPFIAGDRFTAADISLGWILNAAGFLGIGDKLPPRVKSYVQSLVERPAFQRVIGRA